MGILFFSAVLRIHTGIEDLFIREPPGTVKTIAPGRPSIPTMLNFILIALCGIQVIWNPKDLRAKLRILGMIIAAVGALAIVGYIFQCPAPLLFLRRKKYGHRAQHRRFVRIIGYRFDMSKRKIAKLLSLLVIIAGIAVIIGWMFDIGFLTSISPAWRSMRIVTALGFILSGATVYFIARALEGEFDMAQVALSITSFTIVLLMGVSLFSNILGLSGVEDLFIRRASADEKPIILGRPAMLAIVNFLLIAAAAILVMWKMENLQPKLKIIGLIVALIGATATLGYIINVPVLYHFLQGLVPRWPARPPFCSYC